MRLKRPFRSATLMIILIMLLGSAAALSAAGNREDLVLQAEELVQQKRYNDAIEILSRVIAEDPERLDRAEELLSQIREARAAYNQKYEELLETYSGGNLEDAYPLIQELEEMDRAPSESAREALRLAKETAGFVFNRNRWLRIMERAYGELQAGDYPAAVATYAEGFDLSREIFEEYGYDELLVEAALEGAAGMAAALEEAMAVQAGVSAFLEQEEQLYGGVEAEELFRFYGSNRSRFAELAEYRKRLHEYARSFLEQERRIRQASDTKREVHYLVYLNKLLAGRESVAWSEGILHAMDSVWQDGFRQVSAHAEDILDRLFTEAREAYRSGDSAAAGEGFRRLEPLAVEYAQLLALWSSQLYAAPGLRLTGPGAEEKDAFLALSVDNAVKGELASAYLTLLDRQEAADGLQSREESFTGLEEGRRLRGDIQEYRRFLDELRRGWSRREAEVQALSSAGYAEPASLAPLAVLLDDLRQRIAVQDSLELAVVERYTREELEPLIAAVDRERGEIVRGEALAEGVPALLTDQGYSYPAEETEDTLFVRRPDVAIRIWDEAVEALDALDGELREVVERLEREPEEIAGSPGLAALDEAAREQRRLIAAAVAGIPSLKQEMKDRIFTAKRYRQEGDSRIADARRLTAGNRFQAAKERLEQAVDRFDDSLAAMEDRELRRFRDEAIPRIYEEINVAENNLVIREVRQLINQGKQAYSDGDFVRSQSVLVRAQDRWADTNVEPNEEVEYWLTLAQTALSVTSGREIAATDPLYPEMSQYLNQAREDFLKAQDSVRKGRSGDAASYLQNAEQSLLYVQQYFPFNKEARVLSLRITQLKDPAAFDVQFRKNFEEARSLLASNPQKAYIDLKDLQALVPDYPGMARAIENAEYATGIKVRPPDPVKLARSRELYADANRIFRRNARTEFSVALEYCNEAIRLDPNNVEAIRLKDRLSTEIGGGATAVISSVDQKKYQEAVNEFAAGNYLKASIIIDLLLKKPENQNNTKILELKKRLESIR